MLHVIRRQVRRVFQVKKFTLFAVDLGQFGGSDAVENSRYEFRLLDDDDLRHHAVFDVRERRIRYSRRISAGHLCYGLFSDNGALASYLWLSFGALTDGCAPFEWHRRWMLSPEDFYIWDCRTIETFRNQGLYRQGLLRCLEVGRSHGARCAWITCERDNIASMRGILGARFQAFADFEILRARQVVWIRLPNGRIRKLPAGNAVDVHSLICG